MRFVKIVTFHGHAMVSKVATLYGSGFKFAESR